MAAYLRPLSGALSPNPLHDGLVSLSVDFQGINNLRTGEPIPPAVHYKAGLRIVLEEVIYLGHPAGENHLLLRGKAGVRMAFDQRIGLVFFGVRGELAFRLGVAGG